MNCKASHFFPPDLQNENTRFKWPQRESLSLMGTSFSQKTLHICFLTSYTLPLSLPQVTLHIRFLASRIVFSTFLGVPQGLKFLCCRNPKSHSLKSLSFLGDCTLDSTVQAPVIIINNWDCESGALLIGWNKNMDLYRSFVDTICTTNLPGRN